MKSLWVLLTLTLFSPPLKAETSTTRIPFVRGETLAGETISLPEALHGKQAVLVIGFTQASRNAVTQWGTWLANDLSGKQRVAYYEMPVLASVPKLLRGLVAGRIKAAVADSERSHFLPILDHEDAWRTLARYGSADDAYILLVDGQGQVRWQSHGPPTGTTTAALTDGLAIERGR